MTNWRERARALARLAECQRGKPEGDLARQKLAELLERHPEARDYQPVIDLMQRDISCQQFMHMKQAGVSIDGSWTGHTLRETIAKMCADFTYRYKMAVAARELTKAIEFLPYTEEPDAEICV